MRLGAKEQFNNGIVRGSEPEMESGGERTLEFSTLNVLQIASLHPSRTNFIDEAECVLARPCGVRQSSRTGGRLYLEVAGRLKWKVE